MGTNIYLRVRRNKVKDFYNFTRGFLDQFPSGKISSFSIDDENNNGLKEFSFKGSPYSMKDIKKAIEEIAWGVITIKGNFIQEEYLETVLINKRVLNKKGDVLYSHPAITLEGVDGSYESLENNKGLQETLFKIIRKIIENVEPDVVLLTQENNKEITSWFEYYKNPYFFCIEPPYDNKGVVEDIDTSFLENQEILGLLSRCREILSEEELFLIIKSHSSGAIKLRNGVGVFRAPESAIGGGNYKSFVYPRYFIRKELRKRGIKIKEGLAEKYAKDLK